VLTVVAVLVIVGVTLVGLARIGDATLRRARADALADVSALAAVHGGRSAAERVAAAGEGSLVGYRDGVEGAVQVTVELAGARAGAAAAPLGTPLSSTGAAPGDPDPATGRR
jgi:hypothetical protein